MTRVIKPEVKLKPFTVTLSRLEWSSCHVIHNISTSSAVTEEVLNQNRTRQLMSGSEKRSCLALIYIQFNKQVSQGDDSKGQTTHAHTVLSGGLNN